MLAHTRHNKLVVSWRSIATACVQQRMSGGAVLCRFLQWTLIVSIWTFALMPYMAQRASTESLPADLKPSGEDAPVWQRGLGAFGFLIGVFSLGWWAFGRPEYGDISERMTFFSTRLANQRVFGGYLVDIGIYWLAQWLFMRGAGASKQYCAVPFFGLGAWIAAGKPEE